MKGYYETKPFIYKIQFKSLYLKYFLQIIFKKLDVLGLEFLYNVDFSTSIDCNQLFSSGGWSIVGGGSFTSGGQCKYNCEEQSTLATYYILSPDVVEYTQGVQVKTSIPAKYYSYIYVDALYFETKEDIEFTLLDSNNIVVSKNLSTNSLNPSIFEQARSVQCRSSNTKSGYQIINKVTLKFPQKLNSSSPLTFRMYQGKNMLNTQWYGLFMLRVYTNCVENCIDCSSDTSCSKCIQGSDLIQTPKGYLCTQTGNACSLYTQCQSCVIIPGGSGYCIQCKPGYTQDGSGKCTLHPYAKNNSINCGVSQYYSPCDNACKSYSQNCYRNIVNSFDKWQPCPTSIDASSYQCPQTKQILVYQFSNYQVYSCGCTIPFCDTCVSNTQTCDRCSLGYVYDSTNKQCNFQSCPLNYKQDSLTFLCILSYIGQNTQLIVLNSNNLTCLKCYDLNCQICVDEGVKSCKICSTGYRMQNGQCIGQCTPIINQYNSDFQCYNCEDINCTSCTGIGQTDCLKCNSSTFLQKGKCVSQCNKPNQFDSNRVCFECSDTFSCVSCSSSSPTACTQCTSNSYLKNGICVSSCGSGYFSTSIDGGLSRKCQMCDDTINCISCSDELSNSCTQCSSTTFFDNGKCVNQCKNNQYNPTTRKCFYCQDPNLEKCSNSGEYSCLKCGNSTYLDKTGKCVISCPNNQADLVEMECFDCYDQDYCQLCTSSLQDSCTQCSSNTTLSNGKCVLPCSQGQFQMPDKSCKNCYDPTKCVQCNDDTTSGCTKCIDSMYLYLGNCVQNCPNNLFDTNKNCYSCFDDKCLSCPNTLEGTCSKCNNSTFLNKGKCINQCDKNQFDSNNICFECHDLKNCINCSSSNDDGCIQCIDNLVVQDGKCINMCNPGYFIDATIVSKLDPSKYQKKCVQCYDYLNCIQCTNQFKGSCNLCIPGMFLENGICVNECSIKDQFYQNKTCYKCNDENCIHCASSNIGDCNACKLGFFLNQDGTCVGQCFQNQYDENNKCFDCFDNNYCLKCTSILNKTCQKCKPERVLKEGECVLEQECSERYYVETDINNYKRCLPCYDQNCKLCKDGSKSTCLQCIESKFLNQGECVSKCINDQFDSNKNCFECSDQRCDKCSSGQPGNCLRCALPYFQDKGYCIEQCINNQYDSFNNCFLCYDQQNCKKCKGNNQNDCLACIPGMILEEGKCVTDCSQNSYKKINTNGYQECGLCTKGVASSLDENQCKQCFGLDNCQICNGEKQCTKCNQNWILKYGLCVQDCEKSYTVIVNTQDSSRICERCYDGDRCLQCKDSKLGSCQQCSSGSYEYKGQCLSQCPPGYGPIDHQDTKACAPCQDSHCLNCQRSYKICDKCTSYYSTDLNNQCFEDLEIEFNLIQNQGELNLFHIQFNRQIEGLHTLVKDILTVKLKIDKAYSDKYTTDFYVNGDDKVIVQFNFTKSYSGKPFAQVRYKQEKLKYNCKKNEKEINVQLRQNVDSQQIAITQAISETNKAASSVIVNSIYPLAFTGQFAFIATVVDITEILQLMEYASVMQPWNSQIFYDSIQKFNVPFWNMFSLFPNYDKLNDKPPGKFAQDSDISATFIRQAGEHVTIFTICILANGFFRFLLYSFKHIPRAMKVLKSINKYANPVKFSIEILWTVYYDICLGFFLQLTNMKDNIEYLEDGINFSITFLSLFIMILPIVVSYWIKLDIHQELTEEFMEGYRSKYFWLFFYLRRLFCVSVIVVFQEDGYAQLTLLALFHIFHLLFSIKSMPYKSLSQNIRNILQAIFMIGGTVMMYPLIDYDKYSDTAQVNFGWSSCGSFIAIIALELIFFVFSLMKGLYDLAQKILKYIKQRKQVKPIVSVDPSDKFQQRLKAKITSIKLSSNQIDEEEDEDSLSNHPQVKRTQTEDLIQRNTLKDDPLMHIPTNPDELRIRQYTSGSSPSFGSKYILNTEESAQQSPKKSAASNYALESPTNDTNSLFSPNRSNSQSPTRLGGGYFKSRRLIRSTLNEIEMDQNTGQEIIKNKSIKLSLTGSNQNVSMLQSQITSADFEDDYQMSPVKLDGKQLISTSITRIHNISNTSLIKSSDSFPIEKERPRTIILNKIEAEENEDETPHSSKTARKIQRQDIQNIQLKTFSSQLLDNERNLRTPQNQNIRNSPQHRKRASRLQSILKLTRYDSNNSGLNTITDNDIKVIELDQDNKLNFDGSVKNQD